MVIAFEMVYDDRFERRYGFFRKGNIKTGHYGY